MFWLAVALLFGPWLLFALNLAYGAWRWRGMSEGERDVYRRLGRMTHDESEWGRILRRGY